MVRPEWLRPSTDAVRVHHAAPGSVLAPPAQFLIQSIRIARQAQRVVGSVAVSILRDADRAFWTPSIVLPLAFS